MSDQAVLTRMPGRRRVAAGKVGALNQQCTNPEGGEHVMPVPAYASATAWLNSWTGRWAYWRDSPATRRALGKFDLLGGTELARAATLQRIVVACVAAKKFNIDTDPGHCYRKAMAEQRAGQDKLAAAAHLLAKSLQRGDMTIVWALEAFPPAPQVACAQGQSAREIPAHEQWADIFGSLEERLSVRTPELHGSPWRHTCTVGNMLYPAPIKLGRQPDVFTLLAFELVFHLRRHTAGLACHILGQGQRMPEKSVGRPCLPLVAELVNATLGSNFIDRNCKDRLRELPADVRLIPWSEGG